MIRVAALALAALLLAGCGVRPTGMVYAGDAPTATATAAPRAQVFLLARGVPVAVPRAVRPGDPQEVFDALLAGPTVEEVRRGLTTALTGVRQLTARELDGQTLYVEAVPPVVKLSPMALEQIYCTGLALPNQRFIKIAFMNGDGTADPKLNCGGGTGPPGTGLRDGP